MATAYHNLSEYDFNSVPNAENMKFGIVVSEWNFNITGALLKGAVDTLKKHGAKDENILVKTVPGSFELTFGANQMMENCDLDAIIAIGCVIKGDTPHFDYVCMGATQGITELNATGDIPVIYGLITTNTMEQAEDRAGRRTYFFDVRSTKADDYYITITESKKFTEEDGSFHFKKHKIYLYKEDFVSFKEILNEMTDFVLNEKGEEVISERHQKDFKKEYSNESSTFTNVEFDDF